MSFVEHFRSTYACTVSGAGATQTFNTSFVANGMVEAFVVTKATASAFNTSGNLTIAGAISGMTYLNVTATGATGSVVSYYPRTEARSITNALYSPATGAGAVVGIPIQMPVAEAFQIRTTSGCPTDGASAGGSRFTVDFYISR